MTAGLAGQARCSEGSFAGVPSIGRWPPARRALRLGEELDVGCWMLPVSLTAGGPSAGASGSATPGGPAKAGSAVAAGLAGGVCCCESSGTGVPSIGRWTLDVER